MMVFVHKVQIMASLLVLKLNALDQLWLGIKQSCKIQVNGSYNQTERMASNQRVCWYAISQTSLDYFQITVTLE